jgi:hypothetical protein
MSFLVNPDTLPVYVLLIALQERGRRAYVLEQIWRNARLRHDYPFLVEFLLHLRQCLAFVEETFAD